MSNSCGYDAGLLNVDGHLAGRVLCQTPLQIVRDHMEEFLAIVFTHVSGILGCIEHGNERLGKLFLIGDIERWNVDQENGGPGGGHWVLVRFENGRIFSFQTPHAKSVHVQSVSSSLPTTPASASHNSISGTLDDVLSVHTAFGIVPNSV